MITKESVYDIFIKKLVDANDETKTEREHETIMNRFYGWKQGVHDTWNHSFNGDYYYIEKFDSGEIEERPMCCGVFLDWRHKPLTGDKP